MSDSILNTIISDLFNLTKLTYNKAHKTKPIQYVKSPKYKGQGIYIPIGKTSNSTIYLNLKEDSNTYITGTTGSGKSTCLKAMLCNLIQNYKPYELSFYICDLKRSELNIFSDLKHTKAYIYELNNLYPLLASVLSECHRRFDLFAKAKVSNIYEYNAIKENHLDEQILIIEEFVLVQDKKCLSLLKQILAISRACGIHSILTLQRADATLLTPLIKSLISNKISFKCVSETNSNIAIDSPLAFGIDTPGKGYLRCGSRLVHFQAFNITTEQVKEIAKSYEKPVRKDAPSNKPTVVVNATDLVPTEPPVVLNNDKLDLDSF